MIKRVLRTLPPDGASSVDYDGNDITEVAQTVDEAAIITSQVVDILNIERMHAPVLDIDFNATLIPSTTPGKYHLYLDKLVPHEAYMKLLSALAEAEIIEPGYADVSQQRGYTAVRLPWVPKPQKSLF